MYTVIALILLLLAGAVSLAVAFGQDNSKLSKRNNTLQERVNVLQRDKDQLTEALGASYEYNRQLKTVLEVTLKKKQKVVKDSTEVVLNRFDIEE